MDRKKKELKKHNVLTLLNWQKQRKKSNISMA